MGETILIVGLMALTAVLLAIGIAYADQENIKSIRMGTYYIVAAMVSLVLMILVSGSIQP